MVIRTYCFAVILSVVLASAGAQTPVRIDTVLWDVPGVATYSLVAQSDGRKVPHGPFRFQSDLVPSLQGDSLQLVRVSVRGTFAYGRPEQRWNITRTTTRAFQWKVSTARSLDYTLLVREEIVTMNFKEGQKAGTWEWKTREAEKGRFGPEKLRASITFANDSTLSGVFRFEDTLPLWGRVSVTGRVERRGLLDGDLILVHEKEQRPTRETWRFFRGYLTALEVMDVASGEVIRNLEYRDVTELLNRTGESTEGAGRQLTRSVKQFPLPFDNGYAVQDARSEAQQSGVELLTQILDIWRRHMPDGRDSRPYGFTRRFQFVYPAGEDSLWSAVRSQTVLLRSQLRALLAQPNFALRRQQSDTLAFYHAWLLHAREKVGRAEEVVAKVESGYFDFLDRSVYYQNGVPGIHQADTVVYSFGRKVIRVPFSIAPVQGREPSLPVALYRFLRDVERHLRMYEDQIYHRLVSYDNQDFIDSLDEKIFRYQELIRQQYPPPDAVKEEALPRAPFSHKVFVSYHERLINPWFSRYLANAKTFQETAELGERLVCVLEFLAQAKASLDAVSEMPLRWEQQWFTQYRDNPFDVRQLETKILSGVQESSRILLVHYANEVLNARSCEEARQGLENIRQLENRVRYLTQHYQAENVQLLNRSLRRERVPARIKRLLEL